MQQDVRIRYQEALEQSNYGTIPIVTEVRGGRGGQPGRPRISIDPEWLQWAYGHRSIEGIAVYLGVGWSTVCRALLAYGITTQKADPFGTTSVIGVGSDGAPVSSPKITNDMDRLTVYVFHRKAMMGC